MAFQPWYAHQTYPAISIPLNVEGAADNITGLTGGVSGQPGCSFTMVIRSGNVDTNGTGTFAITTSNPALITYQFTDADTLVGTGCNLFVEAVFPGAGGGKAVYDPIAFTFTAS